MNTVFTNDAKYLSARDDLLAVLFFSFRKLRVAMRIRKNCLFEKLNRDWMAISRLS